VQGKKKTVITSGLQAGKTRVRLEPQGKVLHLTVGLPMAGKSTWVKRTGLPIVSPDAIRLAIHGERFNPVAEPLVWLHAEVMVSALFWAGHKQIIVDATNVSVKRRDFWRERFNERNNIVVRMRVFRTPPEVCRERAQAAGDITIVPVIDRMVKEWDLGKFDKGLKDPCHVCGAQVNYETACFCW